MSRFSAYKDAFPNAQLTRSDSGVLEVRFHTDGGKLVFNGHFELNGHARKVGGRRRADRACQCVHPLGSEAHALGRAVVP